LGEEEEGEELGSVFHESDPGHVRGAFKSGAPV
jgi:hypothetical protein